MSWTIAPLPAHPEPWGVAAHRAWQTFWRLAAFVALCLGEAVSWLFTVALPGRAGRLGARTVWLSRFCRRLVRLFDLEIRYEGEPPSNGLLICNHVSYLDVVVLAARAPVAFVAKSEVRHWPGLGVLVAWAGTLFVDRTRRTDVARAGSALAAALQDGHTVCVFAEGTSSDGTRVLPFRSSLLAPAVEWQRPVTTAWIGYRLPGGSAEEEIAYWGDMNFGAHFLHLLSLRRIAVTVRYGMPLPPGTERKELAGRLHAEVEAMGRGEEQSFQRR